MHKQGFTLIELLVVIAIIGILAAVVVVNLAPVKKQGNDAKRIADLKNLSLSLGLYQNDNGSYPTALTALVPDYVSGLPKDPVTNTDYDYVGTTTTFVLRAKLDNDHKVLQSDVDGTNVLGLDCDDANGKNYFCIKP